MSSLNDDRLKKGFVWNTAGCIINALQSVILLAAITRLTDAYIGGIFSIAYAIGQQYRPLGAFEVRVLQVTDTKGQFSFGSYFSFRLITSSAMVLAIALHCLLCYGIGSESVTIGSIALLRVLDTIEDVFQGELQRRRRLDIAARAFTIRVTATTLIFIAAFGTTRNLLIASLLSLAVSAFVLYFLNIPAAKTLFSIKPAITKREIKELMGASIPLFFAAFLSSYLPNAAKFAIDFFLTKEELTFYTILFLIPMAINLIVGSVFQPILSSLAETLAKKGIAPFSKMIIQGIYLSIVASCIVLILSVPLGVPVLSFLYSVNLDPYTGPLIILIFSGTFNAICTVFYYGLVTLRKQKFVFVSYAVSSIIALIASNALTFSLGLLGASLAYLLSMASLTILLGACFHVAKKSRFSA